MRSDFLKQPFTACCIWLFCGVFVPQEKSERIFLYYTQNSSEKIPVSPLVNHGFIFGTKTFFSLKNTCVLGDQEPYTADRGCRLVTVV